MPLPFSHRLSQRRAHRRAVRVLRRSGLFDAGWYLATNPDVAAGGFDPASHYLGHGAAEGRDPGPAFSTRRYYAANPDVEAAGLNALVHFLLHGQYQGRRLHLAADPKPARAKPATWRGIVRRALLRPAHAMIPDADRPGGVLTLASVLGRAPSGWALVAADPTLAAGGAALQITAGGRTHEVALADLLGDRQGGLLRLPEGPGGTAPTAFALVTPPDARGVRPDTPNGPSVTLREIGRVEALARALALTARPVRATMRDGPARTLSGLAAAHAPALTGRYADWVARHDTPSADDLSALRARAVRAKAPAVFSVLVPVHETPADALRAMIASVRAQTWPHWELCLADDGSKAPHVRDILQDAAAADPRVKLALRPRNGNISVASNTALALASGEWLALLDHDDVLAPARAADDGRRDRRPSGQRSVLFGRGQARRGGRTVRPVFQARLQSGAVARPELREPSGRVSYRDGAEARRVPGRLRGQSGLRSDVARHRRDPCPGRPRPARAVSLAAVSRGRDVQRHADGTRHERRAARVAGAGGKPRRDGRGRRRDRQLPPCHPGRSGGLAARDGDRADARRARYPEAVHRRCADAHRLPRHRADRGR